MLQLQRDDDSGASIALDGVVWSKPISIQYSVLSVDGSRTRVYMRATIAFSQIMVRKW